MDETHHVEAQLEEGVSAWPTGLDQGVPPGALRQRPEVYPPEGGSVTIGLRAQEGWAYVSVTDTGVGISEEDLPHVFDRFYRAEESRSWSTGGTGLGLAIAAWIAARHAGRIDVTSRPGLGSRFTLVFP